MQALQRQPADQRAIADDRDHSFVGALKVARDGIAERRGNGGRAVAGIGGIVLRFFDARKRRDALPLAQGMKAVAPPGQNLVRVGLIADVQHDLVFGRIEHVVQRHADFHGSRAARRSGRRSERWYR